MPPPKKLPEVQDVLVLAVASSSYNLKVVVSFMSDLPDSTPKPMLAKIRSSDAAPMPCPCADASRLPDTSKPNTTITAIFRIVLISSRLKKGVLGRPRPAHPNMVQVREWHLNSTKHGNWGCRA